MSYNILRRQNRTNRQFLMLIFLMSIMIFIVYTSFFPSTDNKKHLASHREPDSRYPSGEQLAHGKKTSLLKNQDKQAKIQKNGLLEKDPNRIIKDLHDWDEYKLEPESPFSKFGCKPYADYASRPHAPFSEGELRLPYQRPPKECRTFVSSSIDEVVENVKLRLKDKDLARLFENTFPNTLDTTIRWHKPRNNKGAAFDSDALELQPQTFVVTGDIDAEWLRDSTRQLKPYHKYANQDPKLKDLLLGAINTHVQFVSSEPYCNAFNPPRDSGISFKIPKGDDVTPAYNRRVVFECKYELDSLAHFLELCNDYYEHTGDGSFVNVRWLVALKQLLKTIDQQTMTTYSRDGEVSKNWYTFKRWTDIGTETLPLDGAGNPTGRNTQLIRSSFRPSDDSTIFQFHIPSNAQIVVQFERTAKLLQSAYPNIAQDLESRALLIREGIMQHGIVDHKVFGRVFAYEVDGYGSINIMDDANIPSLLSLPLLGFIKSDNPIYLNTRKMILCKEGNPYYITGVHFHGIGGPHIGTRMAWPMSHIVEGRTLVHQNRESASTRVKELMTILKESTSGLGLMHESVGVDRLGSWTRPWFAWCNAEMGAFILEALELGYLDTVY